MSADLRAARLEELRNKLKAREGKPGFAANVEAIKAQIAGLETDFRDKQSGQFVSLEFATQNPESVKPA